MTQNRLPTRAEATDVANAILDGTDCVMLSAESAMGHYPVEAVTMLAKIAATVEPTRRRIPVSELYQDVATLNVIRAEHLLALSVEASLAYTLPAAVFVSTASGRSARWMGLLRLPVWTVAVSPETRTCQQLQFSRGVIAVHEPNPPEVWNLYARDWLQRHDIPGTFVILAAGPSPTRPDANHRIEIIER